MITTILLLASFLPQERPRNPILDGIAVQAGEDLVTLSEFERVLKRYGEQRKPSTREEVDRLRSVALRDLWTLRLESQAGADLGLDPAQIERMSKLNLRADREKAGLQNYLAQVRAQGLDALADEGNRQQEILRYMWEYSAMGNSFAGRRATRDSTIRPGELRAIYEENKDRLAPETVQLRWLIISSEASGGGDAARLSCEDIRARVLAGEDFALLIEERGSDLLETRGLTPFVPYQALSDPAMVEFARKAEVTDLSEVLPLVNPQTGKVSPELGYGFAELHERRKPPLPAFDSPEVQRTLRQFFMRQQRERILERERDRLRREAYGWVNPLLTGPPQP
jgi:hypothetical protein